MEKKKDECESAKAKGKFIKATQTSSSFASSNLHSHLTEGLIDGDFGNNLVIKQIK